MHRFAIAAAALVFAAGCPKSDETPDAAVAAEVKTVTTQTPPAPPKPPELKPAPTGEDLDKTLYSVGTSIGMSLEQFQLSDAELAEVMKGLSDASANKPSKVKMEEFGPKINDLVRERRVAFLAKKKTLADTQLAAAAKEPGAKKTASGLLFFDLKAGEGASPTAADTVSVHYRGTLLDGTEFDSSYKRNEPAEFPLSGVIKCWGEGVAMMKVGGKAKLVCPPDIAYGERGAPPNIPPNSVLNFEVELLSIKAK